MDNYLASSQTNKFGSSISKGLPLTRIISNKTSVGKLLTDAAEHSEKKGFVFYQNNNPLFLSYEKILSNALIRLGALSELGVKKGEAVILALDDSMDFILNFWALILGGIIPVPVAYPASFARKNVSFEKFETIYNLLNRPHILSDEKFKDNCEEIKFVMDQKSMKIISSEYLGESNINGKIASVDMSSPAIYQFSSGSTSAPKGVILTHKNLLANIEAIISSADISSMDIGLNWMPMHHDMGLIGFLLAPTAAKVQIISMEPKSFIKRPTSLLDLVTKHGVTITGSPNFGYRLILKKVNEQNISSWDLSSLRIIFNGAEPISVKTMLEFTQKLSACGLSSTSVFPVYGMAEACLAVCFPPPSSKPVIHNLDRKKLVCHNIAENCDKDNSNSLMLVDEGFPVNGTHIRIVDNKGIVVPQNTVGEIQICGDSVTSGYVNNPEASKISFQDGWLKTGDMGFISEGRLTVTGRIKDIIFINGQNFFANDIETKIEEIEGVEPGKIAVCAWHDEGAGCERVALFSALTIHKDNIRTFYQRILTHISETLSISMDFVILIRHMPKTTSGKTQHYILIKEFLEGKFHEGIYKMSDLIYSDKQVQNNPSCYENIICQAWADALECPIDLIPRDVSFLSLGGNSIKALQVLNSLESSLGTNLDYDILIKCRTVNDMITYLLDKQFNHGVSEQADIASYKEPYATQVSGSEDKDIAVISMACRFPDASTPEMLWDNITNKRCSIIDIPTNRFELSQFYDSESGKGFCSRGGFIENPYAFNPELFNISEDEAAIMDPQQRIILELVLELLHRAGYSRKDADGKNIGLFIGASTNSYYEYHLHTQTLKIIEKFNSFKSLTKKEQELFVKEWQNNFGTTSSHPNILVDNILNMIAARASQQFNFKGPSMVIDTACSSSLVTLHMACESIRRGECDTAIAGGINLLLTPSAYIQFQNAGALSRCGISRVFDEQADGFVPGEGAGIVMLKTVSKALADKDKILAIIKASEINNDGHSIGVMSPNPDGQRSVIDSVYTKNKINPIGIKYIETHGTGTIIGDPSEVRALNQVFGKWNSSKSSIAIGSIKSNIGHLLSAAGIASFIKVVMGLLNKQIPPVINVNTPNPAIKFHDTPFYLPRETESWETSKKHPRMAAINSFGFGGTNCHMVVEEAPKFFVDSETTFTSKTLSDSNLTYHIPDRKTFKPDFGIREADNDSLYKEALTSMFYQWKWHECPVSNSKELAPGSVVIFGDNNDIMLANKFDKIKNPVYMVTKGNCFCCDDKNKISINPENENDYISLLESIPGSISAVIHLWNYSSLCINPKVILDNPYIMSESALSIIYISRALKKTRSNNTVFMLVTASAHLVKDGDFITNSHQAIGTVILQAIGHENPDIYTHIVDLEKNSFLSCENLEQMLFDELLRVTDKECITAFREDKRYIRTLCKIDKNVQGKEIEIKDGETYLITGGSGALGFELAKALARGAKINLVLTGRKKLPSRESWEEPLCDSNIYSKICMIKDIEKLGANVSYFSVDSADKNGMCDLMEKIHEKYGQLSGVIHASGSIDYSSFRILDKSFETISEVLAPKVQGTIIADMITRGDPLKFFIMVSSISASKAEWASGIGEYAAANAYLSSYCNFRANDNAPGISITINFPLWENTGIGKFLGKSGLNPVVRSGLNPLSPDKAVLSFVKLLNAGKEGVIHIINELKEPDLQSQNTDRKVSRQSSYSSLINLEDLSDVKKSIYQIIANQLDTTLDKLETESNFFELGLDSTGALEIISEIRKQLNIELYPTLIFEYQTPMALAVYIEKNLLKQ